MGGARSFAAVEVLWMLPRIAGTPLSIGGPGCSAAQPAAV